METLEVAPIRKAGQILGMLVQETKRFLTKAQKNTKKVNLWTRKKNRKRRFFGK